jgi:hypothetical protein
LLIKKNLKNVDEENSNFYYLFVSKSILNIYMCFRPSLKMRKQLL